MPKKVLVVYYSQTGQLREIVNSVIAPMKASGEVTLTVEEIKPKTPFPYPWTSDEFFQAMPESVRGIACELQPLSLNGQEAFRPCYHCLATLVPFPFNSRHTLFFSMKQQKNCYPENRS